MVNDKALTEQASRLIENVFGREAVLDIDPLMPGEDYSAFWTMRPDSLWNWGHEMKLRAAICLIITVGTLWMRMLLDTEWNTCIDWD